MTWKEQFEALLCDRGLGGQGLVEAQALLDACHEGGLEAYEVRCLAHRGYLTSEPAS